jgi:hypothetical protein
LFFNPDISVSDAEYDGHLPASVYNYIKLRNTTISGTQMKTKTYLAVAVSVGLLTTISLQAQLVVYDNLGTTALAGSSQPNASNPVFGDTLTLSQGGVLSSISASLFNSGSGGNTGSILTGTMLIRIYDNTVPYAGGVISNPLLGSQTVTWDFTGDGGLAAGYYATDTFDFSGLNLTLPQNILITQSFTLTSGDSIRNGFILFGDPTVGSSPATVYIESTTTAPGLYSFTGNPSQVGYTVNVVPEPSSFALAGLAAASLLVFRRRQ